MTRMIDSSFLENLALRLYEEVRPLILDTMQLDILCDLIRMIKMEIIAGDVIKRSRRFIGVSFLDSSTSVIIPIILKLEEDIRERVLYIAHSYFDSTIKDYVPTTDDVNYPEKLYSKYENEE